MKRILDSIAMLPNWRQEQHFLKLAFVIGILLLTALACNIPGGGGTPPPDGSIGTIQKEFSEVLQNAVQVESKNPLNQDDELRVQNGGVGLLEFGQDLRLRLFNETMAGEIEATHMESDPNSPLIVRLALFAGGFSGQLYRPGSKATFTTPGGAQIVVLGTDFFVVYDPGNGVTMVGNFSGTVGVIAGGETETLASGHYLEIPREGTPGEQQQLRFSFSEFEDRARSRKSPILALQDDFGTAVAQVSPTITSNASETDTDQDGLVDEDESPPCPDPNDPDTDGDGFIDGKDLDPCDANNPGLTATAKASIPTETPVTPVPPTTQAPTDTLTPTPSHTPTPTNTVTNSPTLTDTPVLNSGFITYRVQSNDGTTIYLQNTSGSPVPLIFVPGEAEILDYFPGNSQIGHFAIWNKVADDEVVYILHPEGSRYGPEIYLLDPGWGEIVDASWSPDGEFLIVEASNDGNLVAYFFLADGTLLKERPLSSQ